MDVYTGGTLAGLTQLQEGVFNCPRSGSRVLLSATAGTTYRIAIDNEANSNGNPFTLRIREYDGPPANDDFANAMALPTTTQSTTTGDNTEATAEGAEPFHAGLFPAQSVWYTFTPPASGSYTFDTCAPSTGGGKIAIYTGATLAVLNPEASSFGGCPFAGAKTTLAATGGTTYRVVVDTTQDAASFRLRTRPAGPPANDDFASSLTLPAAAPSSTDGYTLEATSESGEPEHGGNGFGTAHSVWYSWTPSTSGHYRIGTCSSNDGGNRIAVYTGAPSMHCRASADASMLVPVASGRPSR